jgi:hypothetical protein
MLLARFHSNPEAVREGLWVSLALGRRDKKSLRMGGFSLCL